MKELFLRFRNGDMSAREEIIIRNMNLVYFLINKSLYDNTDDNFQIGFIGLIKAVDTFDIESGHSFSTYASRCIMNEIMMYYKNLHKEKAEYILDDSVSRDRREPLVECISDGTDITDSIDSKDFNKVLMRLILNMDNERDKKILSLYFGFDGKTHLMKEIANIVGLDNSSVGRIIKRYLDLFKDYVKELGCGDKPMCLTQRFKDCSSFRLNYLINMLDDEDKKLALKRLDSSDADLSEEEIVKYYGKILPYFDSSMQNVNAEKKLFPRVKRDKVALMCMMDIYRDKVRTLISDDENFDRKELLGLIGAGKAILDSRTYGEASKKIIDYAKKEIERDAVIVDEITYKCARIVQKGVVPFINNLISSGSGSFVLNSYYNRLESKINTAGGNTNKVISDSLNSQIDLIDNCVVSRSVYDFVLNYVKSSKYNKLSIMFFDDEISIYVMRKGLTGRVYDEDDIAYFLGITKDKVKDIYNRVALAVREYKLDENLFVDVGFGL